MQIRRRHRTLTLIRNVYCPDLGRCRAVTLATLPAGLCQIPAGLEERLGPDEVQQLQQLCDDNRQALEQHAQSSAAQQLPELLTQVAAWYRSQPANSKNLARLAEESRAQWSDVLTAMCSAGVGRTRQRRS